MNKSTIDIHDDFVVKFLGCSDDYAAELHEKIYRTLEMNKEFLRDATQFQVEAFVNSYSKKLDNENDFNDFCIIEFTREAASEILKDPDFWS